MMVPQGLHILAGGEQRDVAIVGVGTTQILSRFDALDVWAGSSKAGVSLHMTPG
jgi:hypothetical protein